MQTSKLEVQAKLEVRVTDRSTHEALDEEATGVAKLIEHSSDVLVVAKLVDGMPRHQYVSPSMKRVFGYEPQWYKDRTIVQLVAEGVYLAEELASDTPCGAALARWTKGNPTEKMTTMLSIWNPDRKEWMTAECVVNAVHSDPHQCVIVMRDVSDRVARQKLEVENARLETAREKDLRHQAFLSHEIKNRLLAAKGLATKCRQSVVEHASHLMGTPYKFAESMDHLLGQVDRGVRLCVNEGIMRSIIWGTYTPMEEVVHLKSLLEQCCPPGVRLNVAPGLWHCRIDPQLLNHILDNLVANAVRYGGKTVPGIKGTFPIRIDARVDRRCKLVLSVTNAPGVKHEEIRSKYGSDTSPLFERGRKGIEAKGHIMSQGQGLAIAKMCADAMGGGLSIAFEPTLVVATLTIDYHCVSLNGTPTLPKDLVIASLDDDDVARMVDASTFLQMGIHPSSATNIFGKSEEEIVNFEEIFLQLDPRPNVVILDQHLDHPQFRTILRLGTDIIKPLRSAGYAGKIVMRSANDSSVDVACFLEAGADVVFRKGMSMQSMVLRIASLCGISTELDPEQQVLNVRCGMDEVRTCETHGSQDVSPNSSMNGSPNNSLHGATMWSASSARMRRSLPPTKLRPMRCLGVDDDPFIASTLIGIFSNIKAEVADVIGTSVAEQEAVEAIVMGRRSLTLAPALGKVNGVGGSSLGSSIAYDLVILDNNLDDPETGNPHRDGCKIAKNLREEGFKGIIILHTALSGFELAEVKRHSSLDAVVEKGRPMDDVLQSVIRLRMTIDTIDEVTKPHRVRFQTLERLPPAIRNEHLDILFGTTPQGLHSQIATIEAGDESMQQRSLHRLKGVAASFGLECLEMLFERARSASPETRTFLPMRREIEEVAILLRLEGYIS